MGANRQQGEHPGLLLAAQLLDVIQRTFEEGLVVLAPREIQVGRLLEPLHAPGGVEADVRHDPVLGHEPEARALQVVRGEPAAAQLGWQAGPVALLLGQHLDALGRAVVELVVVAAEHRVEAANGLVIVQHIVGRVHAALGPCAQVGHQVFAVAAVQGLAVHADVGAGNAFEGDDQHIAGASRGSEQLLSVQVESGKTRHLRWRVNDIAFQPFLQAQLYIANACRQPLVREVEQLPLIRRAGAQILHAAVCQEDGKRQCPSMAMQARRRSRAACP
ncbi:hypothetical protein D3C75_731240 [compost metagenome]